MDIQFWLFLLIVFLVALPIVPLPVSIGALLIGVHLNLSSGSQIASINMGNAVLTIVLPTVLLLRTKFRGLLLIMRKPLFWVWGLFVIYVAIATTWSSFRIEALEQVGYLYAYTVWFCVLLALYKMDKRIAYLTITWSAFAILVIVLGGYGLGAKFISTGSGYARLTSFGSPQSFGMYLALMVGIVLSFSWETTKIHGVPRSALIFLLLIALYMSGSRTGWITVLIIFGWFLLLPFIKGHVPYVHILLLQFIAAMMIVGMIAIAFSSNLSHQLWGRARVMQPFVALISPDYSLQDIGTARGRLTNYEATLQILFYSSPVEMVFGHGTSNAKQLVLQGVLLKPDAKEPESLNANRVMHNVYLRILYEWGLFGLALFVTMELGILVTGLRIAKHIRSTEALMLFMVIICIFFFYLTVENILASSGAPAGSVIVLSIAQFVSLRLRKSKRDSLIRK